MKRTAILLPLLVAASAFAQAPQLHKDSTAPTEARIADLLQRMTPEEKVA